MCAQGVRPQIGVIVSLQDEVDVVLVEDRNPVLAQGRRVAPGMRRIDRVVKHHESSRGLAVSKRRVEPLCLPSCLRRGRRRRACCRAPRSRRRRTRSGKPGRDRSRRPVVRQLEERAIEARAHVEVFVVAHAGHERHAIEDAGGPQEEVVPVGPLVAPVDQVAGEQDEIGVGMPAISRLEQPAPALQPVWASPRYRNRDRATSRVPS